MSLIGAIRVVMGLETANYESRLSRVRSKTNAEAAAMSNGFLRMSATGVRAFATLRAGIVAAGGVIAANFVRRHLEMAGSLGEVSQQLGVTSRDLQVYRYIAGQVGVSQDEMDRGLQRLTRSIGDAAHGVGNAGQTFERLGISIRDASGNVRTAGQIIPELADAIARIPDAASRATALTRIFGRAGQQLAPLFEQGSRGIAEFTRRAEELGLVLSDGEIARADQTADKLTELSDALNRNVSRAVAENSGAILGLANALEHLAVAIVRFLGSNPGLVLSMLGAFAGLRLGSRFGPIAGAIGAIGGAIAGGQLSGQTVGTGFVRGSTANVIEQAYQRRWRELGSPRRGTAEYQRAIQDQQLRQLHAAYGRVTERVDTPPAMNASPVDIGDLGGGGGHHQRDDGLRRAHQFDTEQRRLQIDALRAQAENTEGLDERNEIQGRIARLEDEQWLADVNFRQSQGDLNQAQVNRLITLKNALIFEEANGRALEYRQHVQEQENELADRREEIARERLRSDADAATTAEERRRIELEILDLTYQARRNALNRVIAESRDPHAVAMAQLELSNLPGMYNRERAGVLRDTRGPLESFLAEIPQTAAQVNEAMQSIAVEGLRSLTSGLAQSLAGVRSLADAFKALKNAALNALSAIIEMVLQRGLLQLLGALIPGFGSFGSAAGIGSGALAGAGSGGFGGLGFASGGSFDIGGMAGIDRNLLSLNGQPIARVSKGERALIIPQGGGGGRGGGREGDVIVHQSFKFDGVAVTKDEFIQGLLATKSATISAVQQGRRRAA